MKKKNIIAGCLLMAALGSFLACKRDMPLKDKTASPSGTALIKLIDVSPNLMTVLPSPSDSFHVLFNGVKVTGYTSGAAPAMAFNATYPFAGTQNGYASVPAGDQEIKFAKGLNTLDSLVLFTFHETLAANQYYSLIITDSIKSARDSSRIFLQDVFAPLSAGFFGVRFVNAAWNDTANVDIWSTRNNRTIFGNIKPGVATAFSIQGYNSVLSDTLFVRRAGTLVGLDTLVTVSFSNMRSYTLVYKGNALSNKTSDTKRRHLINYLNQ